MEMESTAGSDHSVAVIKRKRSKRKRAVVEAAEITSSYSSGAGDAGSCSNYLSISSDLSEATEEEEYDELVECLMLLAKGICPMDELRKVRQQRRRTKNFSSRRFPETAVTAAAGRRDGVHECKICFRTFPSGQALGGHQSIHKKKPKFKPEERSLALLPPPLVNADEEEEDEVLAPVPLQMFPGNGTVKLHECSECGEKFLSGQALGGHMGRHRTAMTKNKSDSSEEVENGSKGLLLDLNLPPPEFYQIY